jgi:hypothetical protein
LGGIGLKGSYSLGFDSEHTTHAGALFGQNQASGSSSGDAACVHAHYVGVEEKSFFYVVGDGEDGDAFGFCAFLHAEQEVVAHAAVDAGKGLVEQEEAGVGDGEGAGEADALLFAAGQAEDGPLPEGPEDEESEGGIDGLRRGSGECDVLTHGKMREDGCSLRGVGDAAEMRGDGVDVLPGVALSPFERYFKLREQTAGGAQDRAFAASRGAEENRPRRTQVQGDVQPHGSSRSCHPQLMMNVSQARSFAHWQPAHTGAAAP